MPVVLLDSIEFDESGKNCYLKLNQLQDVLPYIKEGKNVELYLIEIRDGNDKLTKRFKPFKKQTLKTGQSYHYNKWGPTLLFDNSLYPNIGKNYKIGMIITKYNEQILLPFEMKSEYGEAGKLIEKLSKIERQLLTLIFENSVLNEAESYLFDSYSRLEENDIEGARTSLRKSLEIIERGVIGKIRVVNLEEESKGLPSNLENLVVNLKNFVHYGGPHPGPAPQSTTEMVLEITIIIIEYLANCLQKGLIEIKT